MSEYAFVLTNIVYEPFVVGVYSNYEDAEARVDWAFREFGQKFVKRDDRRLSSCWTFHLEEGDPTGTYKIQRAFFNAKLCNQ